MHKTKVFISQPMRDKTEKEILEERELAIAKVKELYLYPDEQDVEIINSYFDEFDPETHKPLFFLAKSIELLSEADIAVFTKGWENARGCKLEHSAAEAYGISIMCISDLSLSFSDVLKNITKGKRYARRGWNGKNMFIVYQKAYPEGISCNQQTADAWGLEKGDLFKCNPYLQIKNADGTHSMWVPSIGDLFANDWYEVFLPNDYLYDTESEG